VSLRFCPHAWRKLDKDERAMVYRIGSQLLSRDMTAGNCELFIVQERNREALLRLTNVHGLISGFRACNWHYVRPTAKGQALLLWLWRKRVVL
jgi:hypothetical protein